MYRNKDDDWNTYAGYIVPEITEEIEIKAKKAGILPRYIAKCNQAYATSEKVNQWVEETLVKQREYLELLEYIKKNPNVEINDNGDFVVIISKAAGLKITFSAFETIAHFKKGAIKAYQKQIEEVKFHYPHYKRLRGLDDIEKAWTKTMILSTDSFSKRYL